MHPSNKIAVALFGFIALIAGLTYAMMPPQYEFNILNFEQIKKVTSQDQKIQLPASKLLPNKVAYLCDMSPYMMISLIKNPAHKSMLQNAGFEASTEEVTYIYYFDQNKNYVDQDFIQYYNNIVRWRSEDEKIKDSCLPIKNIDFIIEYREEILYLIPTLQR